jgi:biopolymer transport protein ExbB
MIDLISKGGAFMWPLVVLAAVAMFLIVERALFFQRVRINAGDLLLGLANLVRQNKHDEASQEAARAPGPVARIAYATLARHKLDRKDLRDVAQEAGMLEVSIIEKNLRGLYSIALISPLVGILGTVNGLIKTFVAIQAGSMNSTLEMYEGFYESLVTTGIGLAIAVSCYIFYIYFVGRANRLLRQIERVGIELVNIIYDAKDGLTSHLVVPDPKNSLEDEVQSGQTEQKRKK